MDPKFDMKSRIIIHGGAGHITRDNLPPEAEKAHREALLEIVKNANNLLQQNGATALDVATHAVTQLENNTLFNAGRGAVFTRAGTIELEASVMLSRGSRKRAVGVMRLTTVKNPIKLAREMLLQGERDDGGGAQQHCQLAGETAEQLAEKWGLEKVDPLYFWTKKRWEEHRRGLGIDFDDTALQNALNGATTDFGTSSTTKEWTEHLSSGDDGFMHDPSWNGRDYLPQGTVGCVVLDSTGTICAATSTGGLTNKLPGRIGDTPTIGAGYWSEEWTAHAPKATTQTATLPFVDKVLSTLDRCCGNRLGYSPILSDGETKRTAHSRPPVRVVGMSGTGNGDSFLRVNAVRTAAAIARFSSSPANTISLKSAVAAVAGPNGLLQQSAGENWKRTGEGEGGIIGIEYDSLSAKSHIVADFNCGGMFRGWIDDNGVARALAFRNEAGRADGQASP